MSSILLNSVLLLAITTATLQASVENVALSSSSSPVRGSREGSRAVKLYHPHSRNPIFKCHSEGFYADQNDCTVFYRCVHSGKGKYAVYRFQCGPGTVYDPENDICNHPINTRRIECGGLNKPLNNENEVDDLHKLQSSTSIRPQFTTSPTQPTTKFTTSFTRATTTVQPTIITTIKPISSISPQWTLDPGSNKCISDGFMGDSKDCRKFYRCVDSGRGTFIRYEFACSQSTVWDDEVQGCNHAWAVKNKKCSSQNIGLVTESSKIVNNNNPFNVINLENSQLQRHENYNSGNLQIQSQMHYGWRVNQTQDQIYYNVQSPQLQKQNTNDLVYHQLQIQPNIDKHNIELKKQIKYSDNLNEMKTPLNIKSQSAMNVEFTTNTRAPRDKESYESDICTSSGFMGDSKDCKKFYRCVDNGKGYTKYEFSCGEGTVWDQEIEACNHAWAVKTCGGKRKPQDTIDEKTSTRKDMYTSSQQYSIKATSKLPKPEPTTVWPVPESTTKLTSTANNQNICTDEGFVGDPDDCKKFYRCVGNGRGGFIKYEFACGQGTVWDSEIESCNHEWAVKTCGGSKNPQKHEKEDTSETSTHSFKHENETGNSWSTVQTSTQKTVDNTAKPLRPLSQKNKCSREGFVGDNKDCRIFYRCVDNGKGGYIQYEYSCGQGTVWDPEIESCNHVWAVPKCGGYKVDHEINTTEKYSSTAAYNEENIQSTQPHSTTNSNEVYNQPSEPKPSIGKSSCTEEGFFGETDDCKKFYRCVDNGKGGLTKYEFTCGEGTAWDPEIESCNHEDSVQNCGNTAKKPPSNINVSSQDSTSSSDEKSTTEKSHVDKETNKDDKDCDKEENKNETSKPPTEKSEVCSSEGFFGYKNDCKKFYRCVDNGKGGFTKYDFTCGEGTVWDSEIEGCNHANAVKNCGGSNEQTEKTDVNSNSMTSTTEKSTESASTPTTTTSLGKNDGKCSSEGFYPDPNDCKNFYRCVDNGKGGFTKYDFSCGEGTVWDSEIEGCNHKDAVKNCNRSPEKPSDQSAVTGSSTESINTPENKDCDKEVNESTSKPSSHNNEKCSAEGFFGVKNDCKKFYRCVDNGKGGFTKYDFICGEGTAWDQEIGSCNHEDAVNCGSGNKEKDDADNISGHTSTTTTESNESSISSTSKKPNKGSSDCAAEGFYSDPDDCKKFYRCVGNGKGSYTKYDFTCGDGTLWDQEIEGCNHESAVKCNEGSHHQEISTEKDNGQSSVDTSTEVLTATTVSSSESKTESSSGNKYGKCSSEGFYANEQNCKKFYRCVDNGKGDYTRYDFECGEGTLWDQEIQGCNHENAVTCTNKPEQSSSEASSTQDHSKDDSTTEKTSHSSQENSNNKPSGSQNRCENEGFFGNSNDCKKFYRCVDNGKGGLTKYDFTCGEGTIWDQEITTCNHEWAVKKPSCKDFSGTQAQSSTQASQQPASSQSTSTESAQNQTPHTTQSHESNTKEPCDKDETKSENNTISCPHAGFYPHPSDCKKFYRCVDWDGNGEKYSVFHFECGEGTIWDPKLETCNYEDSVYPPRACAGKQSESSTSKNEESSTSQFTTHDESSTESQTSTEITTTTKTTTTAATTTEETTSESKTTESATTEVSPSESTMAQETTTEGTNTEETTAPAIEGTSSSEGTITTTEKLSSESTTSEYTSETTSSESTTSQSTTSESATSESSTPQSTTSEFTTSESSPSESSTSESTTSESTTSESTTSDSTTFESSTSESTPSESTSESEPESTTSDSETSEASTSETTTSETTTTEPMTSESTTSEASTTDSTESTTEQQTMETTESNAESGTEGATDSTTESSTVSPSKKDCPETEEGQYLFVCPTGFKRHPKYCNLFYQCTNSPNDHDAKIAVFHCPNNTIYDEKENQCLPEEDTEQKCEGQISETESRKFRKLNDYPPPPISIQTACPREGHFAFEKENKCSHLFLKCQRSSKRIQGFVHQCPEGYIYWTVSRRCERAAVVNGCSKASKFRRWEIPMETYNIAN